MGSHTVIPNTEAAILARLIEARDTMSRDVAEYLLSFDFAESDLNRMNSLAERARGGTLTKHNNMCTRRSTPPNESKRAAKASGP